MTKQIEPKGWEEQVRDIAVYLNCNEDELVSEMKHLLEEIAKEVEAKDRKFTTANTLRKHIRRTFKKFGIANAGIPYTMQVKELQNSLMKTNFTGRLSP